jgi:hypothetical protein
LNHDNIVRFVGVFTPMSLYDYSYLASDYAIYGNVRTFLDRLDRSGQRDTWASSLVSVAVSKVFFINQPNRLLLCVGQRRFIRNGISSQWGDNL